MDDLQPYTAPEPDAPAAEAAPAEPVAKGRLVGRILLGRDHMPPEPINTAADPNLADAQPIWDESMVIGADSGVKDVIVWARNRAGSELEPRTETVTLTIRDGRFVPRLVVATPGQTVRLVNDDPTTYSLRALPQVEQSLDGKPNPEHSWELGPGESVEHTFAHPEVAIPIVGSYPHDWMAGWVAVLDRTYTRTDSAGRYELELPLGPQDVKLWHETLDTRETFVTVSADEEVDWSVNFTQGRRGRGR